MGAVFAYAVEGFEDVRLSDLFVQKIFELRCPACVFGGKINQRYFPLLLIVVMMDGTMTITTYVFLLKVVNSGRFRLHYQW